MNTELSARDARSRSLDLMIKLCADAVADDLAFASAMRKMIKLLPAEERADAKLLTREQCATAFADRLSYCTGATRYDSRLPAQTIMRTRKIIPVSTD